MLKQQMTHYVSAFIISILIWFGILLHQGQYPVEALSLTSIGSTENFKWVEISDRYYGYNFLVPATWYKQMGVTPDRWVFFSDPSVLDHTLVHPVPMPEGLIKVDFGVEPVANFLPEIEVRNAIIDERSNATREDLIPLLPSGTWTEVDGLPTLLVEYNQQQLEAGHGGEFIEATSVYILAEHMVYYLWIAYSPPTIGDQAIATSNYESVKSHILESFVIDSK